MHKEDKECNNSDSIENRASPSGHQFLFPSHLYKRLFDSQIFPQKMDQKSAQSQGIPRNLLFSSNDVDVAGGGERGDGGKTEEEISGRQNNKENSNEVNIFSTISFLLMRFPSLLLFVSSMS